MKALLEVEVQLDFCSFFYIKVKTALHFISVLFLSDESSHTTATVAIQWK